jgi:hypothetical protein
MASISGGFKNKFDTQKYYNNFFLAFDWSYQSRLG